jgi:NitT/TauT family transport system ATP-binding protein
MKLHIASLSHTYSSARKDSIHALEDITLDVDSGEFVALIGQSGCGKSSLLRILAGLLKPSAGDVSLGGLSPLAAAAQKQISWMAQKPALLPWRTVTANVDLAQKINPQNSRSLLLPAELLDLVRLSEFAHAYPFMLSGGMQQRVALARTLALGASLWLMDEPFTALDELTREDLSLEVLRLWDRFRPTVVWVTHSILESVRMADRVIVMSHRPGQIFAQHKIQLPRPRDDTAARFQEIVRSIRDDLRGSA